MNITSVMIMLWCLINFTRSIFLREARMKYVKEICLITKTWKQNSWQELTLLEMTMAILSTSPLKLDKIETNNHKMILEQ